MTGTSDDGNLAVERGGRLGLELERLRNRDLAENKKSIINNDRWREVKARNGGTDLLERDVDPAPGRARLESAVGDDLSGRLSQQVSHTTA